MKEGGWTVRLGRGQRRCEECGWPTSGSLRMTKRVDGSLVRACEDCALDLERAKDEAAKRQQGAA